MDEKPKSNPLDEFIEITTDSQKSRGLPSPYTKRETIIQDCSEGAGFGETRESVSNDPRGIHASKLEGPDTSKVSGVGAMSCESIEVMQKLSKEQLQYGKEDYLDDGKFDD